VSPEKPSGRLLVIEDDPNLSAMLTQHFAAQGYDVQAAPTGAQGMALAQTARPNLILLAAGLPDMPGLDVFRALRDKPRTGHIPVMMMAGQGDSLLQNKVLAEGAYDFLEKPIDLDILSLRVRNALRRAEREGLAETRTGLPTGRLIDERIELLASEHGWYKIDLTIEHFGAFRDLYGFVTANEALRFAGNLIAQLVSEHGTPEDFVGHMASSEHFVIVTTQACGPQLRGVLAGRVSEELQSFYSFVEREQGFVLLEDGAGGSTQKPLMTAQLSTMQDKLDADAEAHPPSDEASWVDAEEDHHKPDTSAPGSVFEW
jgi:PleD family two-component response regulator